MWAKRGMKLAGNRSSSDFAVIIGSNKNYENEMMRDFYLYDSSHTHTHIGNNGDLNLKVVHGRTMSDG